jgi:hypothetical protein
MDGMIYATPEEQAADVERKTNEAEAQRKRDLVSLARERFATAEEAESEVRRLADEDIRFRSGEQWDAKILAARKLDNRPALVINRIPQFERHVTNEQRQARPAIQVSPVDSSADKETAEVLQGLIRHIEYDSGADVAYDTALTSAVRGGLGYFRAVTEYEGDETFEQGLKIKRVRDPFSVYMDPGTQEQDASDANWAFVVDDGISKEAFKAEYPECEASEGGWGNRQSARGDSCQVVEYFYRERVADELLRLVPVAVDEATGQPLQHPETGMPVALGEPIVTLRSELPKEGLSGHVITDERPTYRVKVCWAKIAGNTVIEEREFPSKWIPVVPVLGDELWVGGRRILEGIVRHAKDPQRMYNFWTSAITESIALAPKAPFIAAEGQLEGHEKEWGEASSRNKAFLQYKPKAIGGTILPPPQRNTYEAPIAAMTQAMMFAADDMKATTGIYDAALGNRSNEQSGRAILARQNQSQVSSLHFSDNLARALRHLGRILIDAIPRVYSGERVVRILGEDQSEKLVAVNGAPKPKGQERMYDLGTGRYDVTVSMGPSFTSKRQESVASMMELSRANPQMAQALGDLMVGNMDWPGAQKMAERLKKLLPPHLQEPDDKQKVDPAALAQQLAQQGQMLQQLTQELNVAQDTIATKALELQSAERKDLIARHVDLAKAFATTGPEDAEGRMVLLMEMRSIQGRLGEHFPPAPEAPSQNQPQQMGAP